MNLLLLFDRDFVAPGIAVIRGRRREHVEGILGCAEGDSLVAGLADGNLGEATIETVDADAITLRFHETAPPPPPSPVSLALALPRPKVLNRVIAAAASLGVKRIALINAWKVEKSYWKSPRLSAENIEAQCIAGLEQAKDTILPTVTLHRFFRKFVEEDLEAFRTGGTVFTAHPDAATECPRAITEPVTLVIGPEGGFIDAELASLERAGSRTVSLGPRVLRVETVVSTIIGRLHR